MGRHKKIPGACPTCNRTPDEVPFGMVNGVPRHYCKACRSLKDRARTKLRGAFFPGKTRVDSYNSRVLNSLKGGFYELIYKASANTADGFLMVAERAVYVHLGDQGYLIEIDNVGIGLFLANRGLVATDNVIVVKDTEGADIKEEDILRNHKLYKVYEVQKLWSRVG